MLCGISVCFRTLFHSQRQVAHALLTRPPLSLLNASRRIDLVSSVRLECVRHAASVHPEPGSNSRNILYTVLSDYIPILSSFCSALLLFCKSFIFSLESRVPCTSVYNFLSTFILCTFSRSHISLYDVLFNFQGSKVRAFCSAVLDALRL